jgi:subtilisin-like proprotein convertase family protein
MMHKKVATKQGLGSLLDMVCGNVSKHSTRRRSRWPRYQNDHLRHVSNAATPETLERRFAFDVAAFAAAGQDQVTLVVSEGDDLYLTQVTSSPQNLLYGTSSSYLGDEFNAGVISDFDSYPKFMIAEGNTINESVIRADGSPAWGVIRDTETFFLPKHVPHYSANYPVWELSGPPDNDVVYRKEGGPLVSTETRGRIEVTQPDGALSTWTFTNWNQETASIRFDNQNISIVEGANYGGQGRMFSASVAPQFEAITPGYYYPVGIAAEYEGAITNGPTPTGFRVVWNQPLTQSTNPQLIFDQYYTESRTQITAERILPAAFAVESPPPQGPDNFYQVTYTLGEAEGNGLVPGALSGKVSILPYGILGEVEFIGTDINRTGIDSDYEGTYALQFKKADGSFTDGNIAETRVFDNENVGQQSSLRNFSGDDRNVIPGPGGLEPIQIDGFYNTKQGTITLRFRQAYQTTDGRIAGAIGAKPGRVELQDVRYAVYEAATQGNSGQQASRVFIEPGLNIEASLTVELQSPGAALYVNNPISATGNEPLFESPVTEGAIALRASEIYLNADIQAQQRIDIGSTTEVAQKTGAGLESPTGTTLALYRDPKAIINVQGARIQAISPVLGHEGSGYTPGYRPKVAISRPVEAQAEISAGRLVGGLADLGIGNKGAGYTQFGGGNGTTQLTISPPELLGWDENNDGVIDYPAVQATATATFVGGVVQGITITNPGFGYVSPPTVTLPAPARKEEKNTQTGEVTFSPIQAVVAVQYGGVLESLSVDDGGYNYNPQAEGFSTPSLDPQDPGYIPQPNPLPETKVLLTAKNAQGLPTDSFEIYPLVGDQRFIARALLPDGGLKGDVVLTANDSDGDGENDETIITGAYTWLADVGANGELDPLFDIAVDGPPALDPLSVPRPYIQAQVGASGRIDEYDIQTRGQGYGVVPGYKVQLSGLPEEPGTVVARTAQGQVSLVAERPDIIFEIAKNTDSFLDGDDLDGHADNQEVASMEIIFKNETLTEQPDEVTGEFDSSVWQSVDPSAYAEADVGALFKNSVKRTIVLQKPEVQDPGNPLGNFATNSFEIDASSINDKLDYFDGELFGIGDASLDLLAADYESAEDLEKIELLRNDFGQEYRLVVKKTQVLTYVQPDGTIVELDGGDQPDDEYQSIGKAYLGTGYGYQSVPVVQVQRPSAENAPAEFTVVLDGEGRIKDFEINSPGNGYEEGVEYVVAVSALKNPQTTEIVEFNSTISAPHYDIRVADDVRDDARLKGEVFVSPLSVIGNGGSPSDSVYIEADTTDVYVAGGINADTQSYVFQSPIYRQLDGPFTFSTRNRDTGLSSGLLAGETLTLAFGAETSDFDPNGSIITHVVDVDTDLLVQVNPTLNNAGSLRVTAGADGTDSFPVDINVRDIGSLDVDSNIRSSGEVAITAASSLNVNAAINTDGDLALTGGLSAGRVSLSGPLTSTRGSISLQGGTLDVRADVVAEGQGDVGDILLRATGGDVNVSGAVRTGDNGNIRIEQSAASVVAGSFDSVVTKTTGDGDTAKTTTSKVLNLPINNTITTTASLTVGTAPANFDRITVSLDIDHTYVGDLTGLVTAPSGERITLFSRNGGSSDDYDNVTFDSLAIRSLSSSQPPFSGEYRPIDVISTPSNTEGVWTLSITDAFSGDSGTLNAFSIRFIGADGEVEVGEAGSVKGVGILESEQIVVQALGSVGAASGGLSELLKTKSSSVTCLFCYRISWPTVVTGWSVSGRCSCGSCYFFFRYRCCRAIWRINARLTSRYTKCTECCL